MKKTKGKKKLLLIIPLIILLVLAISFIGWIVKPAKKMNIACFGYYCSCDGWTGSKSD